MCERFTEADMVAFVTMCLDVMGGGVRSHIFVGPYNLKIGTTSCRVEVKVGPDWYQESG